MNREHFRAFLWLRWRLRVNAFRKAGPLNLALFVAFVAVALGAAVALLVIGFVVGLLVLPGTAPAVHLFIWDGVTLAFLFFWMIGLLTELQRSEALALDKVLHLPVSPSGAFVINYLSSLFSLSLLAFLSATVGLILGQACAGSVRVLLLVPLLVAFVLAVTAVTYQFQGWVASLMANPRRRRAVVAGVTVGFIVLVQVPNLVNVAHLRSARTVPDPPTVLQEPAPTAGAGNIEQAITPEEFNRRASANQKAFDDRVAAERQHAMDRAERIARIGSLAFPPGWLALGAHELAAGAAWPALLGTLGLGLVAAVSLRGSYRTTLRLYTGSFTGPRGRPAPAPAAPIDPSRVRLLERRLPWVSEQASAVALAAFRSLTRAPEAKINLLAPLIMPIVFAGVYLSAGMEVPSAAVRPVVAFAAGMMVMVMTGMQLTGNQFGYDRAGFRTYVLSPVPRREILLGKNLAVAPIGLGVGLVLALLLGTVYPMRIDHYPAVAAQLVSAFMLFCMLANALSIMAPIPMASGSMQPARVSVVPALLQMVFCAVLPVALVPVMLPIGAEYLLAEQANVRGWPVSLALSLLVLGGTLALYRGVLTIEGRWLADRERAVLEVVTRAGE
ncbi:hypothetical protein [Frigoriglobus tundricola]|uniref:Uncharacterized protein n=1 Tax=Frigoriglobus tundricola TaxID=2774151 RepID=A0A6M5Z1S8_9BACT|nr:hypothetical protein [Frigoriglobus tundricola]QJX00330.1 hypothetical protein FTUN_7956 [Frigoriglobus tundricola]